MASHSEQSTWDDATQRVMMNPVKNTEENTQVVIFRGIPGSGKSTLAGELQSMEPDTEIVSADNYFIDENGVYTFNPKEIKNAHAHCMSDFNNALKDRNVKMIIVDNTNIQRWNFLAYIRIAEKMRAQVTVIRFDADKSVGIRNTHGVPEETIQSMYSKWEDYRGEIIIKAQ